MQELLEKEKKEAHELITLLEDQILELDKFSVNNDDVFDVQVYNLKEVIKDLRKQLS